MSTSSAFVNLDKSSDVSKTKIMFQKIIRNLLQSTDFLQDVSENYNFLRLRCNQVSSVLTIRCHLSVLTIRCYLSVLTIRCQLSVSTVRWPFILGQLVCAFAGRYSFSKSLVTKWDFSMRTFIWMCLKNMRYCFCL